MVFIYENLGLNRKIEKLQDMPFITEVGKDFLLDLHGNVSQQILKIHKQFREHEISEPQYRQLANEIKEKYFKIIDDKDTLSEIRDKKQFLIYEVPIIFKFSFFRAEEVCFCLLYTYVLDLPEDCIY